MAASRASKRLLLTLVVTASILAATLPVFASHSGLIPHVCSLEALRANATSCTVCHLGVLLINITTFLVQYVALPSAALLIAIGGLAMLTSGGSDQRYTQAKTILTRAIIGLIIVLAAWALVSLVIKILTGGADRLTDLAPWSTIREDICI